MYIVACGKTRRMGVLPLLLSLSSRCQALKAVHVGEPINIYGHCCLIMSRAFPLLFLSFKQMSTVVWVYDNDVEIQAWERVSAAGPPHFFTIA